MKHRIFLTTALPLITACPWCFHFPSFVYVLAVAPLWITAWLCFHYAVGFLNASCIAYSVVLCGVVAYMNHLAIQARQQHFQATRALEEERRLLIETQNSINHLT